MPKQFLNINSFGKGINNVKNPRDLSIGEMADCRNWNVSKNGELVPRSEWNSENDNDAYRIGDNYVDNFTASLNPGYGLFYFEADDPIGVRGTTIRANGSTGDIGQGPDGNSEYTLCFFDGNKIFVNDDNFWTANNLIPGVSSSHLPVKIIISGAEESSNNGVFTVTSVTSALNDAQITVESSNSHTMDGAMVATFLNLKETTLTAENVVNDRIVSIKRLGFVGDSLLAVGNTDDGKVDVFIDSDNAISTDKITLLNASDSGEVSEFVYYYSDGALRVADGNHKNESTPKWYGHIERDVLITDATTIGRTIPSDLYEENNDLAAPTNANFTDAGNIDGSAEFPTKGAGWGLSVISGGDKGDWEDKTYEFACTFIYDGNQESLLTTFDDTFDATEGKKLAFSVYAQRDSNNEYPRRVSGGRIYIREELSNDEWTLFADINIKDGARPTLEDEYFQWRLDGAGEYRVNNTDTVGNRGSAFFILKSSKPNLDTYETLNGFSPSTKQIAFGQQNSGYKTAVVAGRRAFVANVKYDENNIGLESQSNDFSHFGDRIMYSEIGKFDTFPAHNFIDVAKGDGEDYVKLSFYGDRLLAFKQRTLQILNIASPSASGWFLEKTVPYAGTFYPYSVCDTEYGIVWANKNGAYLYDGSTVTNITDNKIADDGSTSYSSVNWSSFSSINKIIVGYIPDLKQAIFIDRPDSASHAFYYDFRYKSWYYGTNAAPNKNNSGVTNGSSFTPIISNMVNDSNGKLLVAYDTQSTNLGDVGTNKVVVTYHQTSEQSHTSYLLQTPDLHFNEPGKTKKVYAIYINYRHTGSTAINDSQVEYMTNNSGTWVAFNHLSDTIPQTHSSNYNYSTIKLKPSATPVSCQSIAFRFNFNSLAEDSKFAINDVVVEYRTLNKRAA
jgi:hypothetical protein